jgi:hypothetical protein
MNAPFRCRHRLLVPVLVGLLFGAAGAFAAAAEPPSSPVFTNEDLPAEPGIGVVGRSVPAPPDLPRTAPPAPAEPGPEALPPAPPADTGGRLVIRIVPGQDAPEVTLDDRPVAPAPLLDPLDLLDQLGPRRAPERPSIVIPGPGEPAPRDDVIVAPDPPVDIWA